MTTKQCCELAAGFLLLALLHGITACTPGILSNVDVVSTIEPYVNPDVSLAPFLRAYDNHADALTLKRQLTLPWAQGVEVIALDSEMPFTVASCHEFFEAERRGATTIWSREFADYRMIGLQCHAILWIIGAEPASQSGIGDFIMDAFLADRLPADLALVISDSQAQRIRDNDTLSSWSDVTEFELVETIGASNAIFHIDGGVQEVTLLARADFTQDQYEDVLLRMSNFLDDSGHLSTQLFLLTRYSEDDDFVLVTKLH